MRWLADAVYLLAGLLYLPFALYQAVVLGKNRHGWRQRFGAVPAFDPSRRRVWVHAVSLGEINCTPQLAEALAQRIPNCDIVFSTTTDTGYARAIHLYGADRVFRFPLDFSVVIGRVLRRVRPSLIVLVELETWFNLIRGAGQRGIPVAVVNGRLTERSARRFHRLGSLPRAMFKGLAWVGVQDETIAARFRSLGVSGERIEVTSSLKWDTAVVADHIEGEEALAQAAGIDRSRPLWVCGSTGPGEEALILEAYRRLIDASPSLVRSVLGKPADREVLGLPTLGIVPRKPERFDEAGRIIERAGFPCVRRSERPDGARGEVIDPPVVVLGDTMGELRKFYSLADVVFVGRSLVPMGGSDPMEVAALGKPIVVGPYTENFQMPVEALRRADAVRIVDAPETLAAEIGAILQDASYAQSLGSRAREVVLNNQGATGRTANRLADLMRSVLGGAEK